MIVIAKEIQTAAYLFASILFILSLGGLASQESAKRGVIYGIVGMIIAIIATVLGQGVEGHVYIIGAIAIGFCSYDFISLDAGHITKVITIAMFLPLFASCWLIFQKKYITGSILFLIFLYEIIAGGHVQIAYYSLILIGLYMLYAFVYNILQKETKHAFIKEYGESYPIEKLKTDSRVEIWGI